MDESAKLLTNVQELLSLELGGIRRLEGDKLTSVKTYFKIEWEPEPIYVGSVNLIVTGAEDYMAIKLDPELSLVAKVEIPEYNSFMYIIRYHNSPFLSSLLSDTEIDNVKHMEDGR